MIRLHHRQGTAESLHAGSVPEVDAAEAWVLDPTGPALVLGSTQPDTDVDRAAATAVGLEVCRRSSGGGAVLLWPGGQLWVDVVLPRSDPRWDDRVDVAAHWVGEAWALALQVGAGLVGVEVHRGANRPGPLAAVACFDGIGPGEVLLPGGASGEDRIKLVGLSQRRTVAGARFQTTCYLGGAELPSSVRLALPGIVAPGAVRLGADPHLVALALVPPAPRAGAPASPTGLAGILAAAL